MMGVLGRERFDWAFNYPNTRFYCWILVGNIAQPRMHTYLDRKEEPVLLD
jgi:hypothetical protein